MTVLMDFVLSFFFVVAQLVQFLCAVCISFNPALILAPDFMVMVCYRHHLCKCCMNTSYIPGNAEQCLCALTGE